MSFIDETDLEAFVSDQGWLTKDPENPPAGLMQAIEQADSIIYQITGIPIPESPEETEPALRNIACALVIWFTTGGQQNIDEVEYNRRKKQYDDAMQMLREIEWKNSDGEVLQPKPVSVIKSNILRCTESL